MNQHNTPQEVIDTACRAVDRWIGEGLCNTCALTTVSVLKECDREKLEVLWIEYKVNQLDNETALD